MPSTLLRMKTVPRMAVSCKHDVIIVMSIFLGRVSNCEKSAKFTKCANHHRDYFSL